jgi:hypothetical protein
MNDATRTDKARLGDYVIYPNGDIGAVVATFLGEPYIIRNIKSSEIIDPIIPHQIYVRLDQETKDQSR